MENFDQGIISLHFGSQATRLGLDYYFLESGQMFEQDDPVNHNALFSNGIEPRSLFFDFARNQEEYFPKQISKEDEKLKQNEQNLWGNKIQVCQNLPEEEEKKVETQDQNMRSTYYQMVGKKQKFIKMSNEFQFEFSSYLSGTQQFKQEEQKEVFSDKVRHILERTDLIDGFQCFADCYNGYGAFCDDLVGWLKTECPKKSVIYIPILQQFGQFQTEVEEQVQIINELLVYSQSQELYELILPFDSSSQSLHYCDNTKLTTFNDISITTSPLISNITLPYRLKTQLEMSQYIDKMCPNWRKNILNVSSQIPLFDENNKQQNEKIWDLEENFKEFSYFQDHTLDPKITKKLHYNASYVIRGMPEKFTSQEIQKYFSNTTDFRILQSPLLIPTEFSKYLNTPYQASFQSFDENTCTLPLETSCFTSERFGFYLDKLINIYKGLKPSVKQHFCQDYFTFDELKEIENSIYCIRDSYLH